MSLPLPAGLIRDESAFEHGSRLRVGVLVVNLGTPDAPDGPSLRRYLKEFLSDPRVVEIPRLSRIMGDLRPMPVTMELTKKSTLSPVS